MATVTVHTTLKLHPVAHPHDQAVLAALEDWGVSADASRDADGRP